MLQPDASLPCPGQRSPVNPRSVVPVCRTCALWRRFAEMGPHLPAVAEYDGMRWQCDRAQPAPQAGPADAPAPVSPQDAAACPASALPPAPGGAGGSSSIR